MAFNFDPILTINAIFCFLSFIFGIIIYFKSNRTSFLFIGSAFIFFGTSHLMNLLGIGTKFSMLLIAIRTFAYLLVILGLIKAIKE